MATEFTVKVPDRPGQLGMLTSALGEAGVNLRGIGGSKGTIGILGIPMAPVLLLRMTLKEQRAFSIQGPSMESIRRALDLLGSRPQIGKILTGVVPLERTNDAFDRLAAGDGGIKVLVQPGG